MKKIVRLDIRKMRRQVVMEMKDQVLITEIILLKGHEQNYVILVC